MTNHQRVLNELFSSTAKHPFPKEDHGSFIDRTKHLILAFTPKELAELYVDVALLKTLLNFLKEQHWLEQKKALPKLQFKTFVQSFFKNELGHIEYLHSFLENCSIESIKPLGQKSVYIENLTLEEVKKLPFNSQKIFATHVLTLMAKIFEFENQLQIQKKEQGLNVELSMYRTFDGLDYILNLNYKADLGMKTDPTHNERLYEGAGIGVQSGYSTVLTALNYLNPKQGARFIDLGSGYGRVGLIIGLLRPDIQFTGYEYVPHRVEIARSSSHNLELENHVHFLTQDLSLNEFQIPTAEIYYLYDPFSKETYSHVLSQLVKLSQVQKIFIATKGNARGWLLEVNEKEGWLPPKEFDGGNLCLFEWGR
jgi:SAM-dependent methyltransferase